MKLKNYTYKYKWLCSRWGVCNIYKKIITLSYKLFAHKKDIIDYVIVHEMAHSFVPNHSKKFWIEVEKIIPNWKTLRKELNYKYAY
jgi:predicted metal-dependent hydrolase